MDSIAEDIDFKDSEHLWNAYKSSALQLKELLSSYKSAGATVKTNFGCDDLSKIKQYDAVIIIAHHFRGSDSVEFCNGPISTSDLVKVIPPDYSGVLDISSCYSSSFQLEIKMHAPSCHIIATVTKTSLRVRTVIYERLLDYLKKSSDDYLTAFSKVTNELYRAAAESSREEKPSSISLGGKQKSTIYAPVEVSCGDTFIVQIFLHKDEDSDEVELQAQMVDESAQKRNSKSLSIKLKKGDKVDICLQAQNTSKEDFTIPKPRRSVIWQNEPSSVEYTVSVSKECTQSTFIGGVMFAVNKLPKGSMLFKTKISESGNMKDCASFESVPYDKASEMQTARLDLQKRMKKFLKTLSDKEDGDCTSKVICERCLKILSEDLSHIKNDIPRVFISSTSDMAPYRKVVEERARACEMFPDMYELWGQGNDYPRDMCCKHVLQSDFFVCLLGPKYGFVEPIWDKSMTEIEYRVAKSAGIPVLIYILNEGKDADARQKEFLNEVRTQRMVGMFRDAMSLAILASSELLTLKSTQK